MGNRGPVIADEVFTIFVASGITAKFTGRGQHVCAFSLSD